MARFRPAQSEISIIASTRLLAPACSVCGLSGEGAMRSSDGLMGVMGRRHQPIWPSRAPICHPATYAAPWSPSIFASSKVQPHLPGARRRQPPVTRDDVASRDARCCVRGASCPARARAPCAPSATPAARPARVLDHPVRVIPPAAHGTTVRTSSPSPPSLPDQLIGHSTHHQGCVVSPAAPIQPNP